MPGKKSKDKGARGERELCALLQEHLGVECVRNLEQVRNGGADCISLPGWSIEVKRQEKLYLKTWWEDAVSKSNGDVPVLAYRRSRQLWRFMMPMGKPASYNFLMTKTLFLEGFCYIVRESL